ncbi:MAG: hypothetical protein IPN95_17145 [Bacteroidetes bacterium]|nr:hypothetical protein [Bacteroidota bacterium]
MEANQIEISGWKFAKTAIGERFGMWVDAADCCALQVYLDCRFRNLTEAWVHQKLASLAIGVNTQALNYSVMAYSEAHLTPTEDDPSIAAYLSRPQQPYRGPFYVFSFLTCEELTIVPHPVWKAITEIAVKHHLESQDPPLSAVETSLTPEELRQCFRELGLPLQFRQFQDIRCGIIESGVVRYTRIIDPALEALNWLYLYMEQMIPPYNLTMECIRKGQGFGGKGIECQPNAHEPSEDAADTRSWTISVDWVKEPVVMTQAKLLQLLDFLMFVD